MAISELYASTIVKVRAFFGFRGFEVHPDRITAALGIHPDQTRVQGEEISIRFGSGKWRVPMNSWAIGSSVESKDVNVHLRQLLSRLGALAPKLDPAWGEPAFNVLWKGTSLYAGSGPFYEPDVLEGIAALGAAMYQDIYSVDATEED